MLAKCKTIDWEIYMLRRYSNSTKHSCKTVVKTYQLMVKKYTPANPPTFASLSEVKKTQISCFFNIQRRKYKAFTFLLRATLEQTVIEAVS